MESKEEAYDWKRSAIEAYRIKKESVREEILTKAFDTISSMLGVSVKDLKKSHQITDSNLLSIILDGFHFMVDLETTNKAFDLDKPIKIAMRRRADYSATPILVDSQEDVGLFLSGFSKEILDE